MRSDEIWSMILVTLVSRSGPLRTQASWELVKPRTSRPYCQPLTV